MRRKAVREEQLLIQPLAEAPPPQARLKTDCNIHKVNIQRARAQNTQAGRRTCSGSWVMTAQPHSPVSLLMLLPVKLNLSCSINIYIDSVFCEDLRLRAEDVQLEPLRRLPRASLAPPSASRPAADLIHSGQYLSAPWAQRSSHGRIRGARVDSGRDFVCLHSVCVRSYRNSNKPSITVMHSSLIWCLQLCLAKTALV